MSLSPIDHDSLANIPHLLNQQRKSLYDCHLNSDSFIMVHTSYIGSGPYCYANCLSMLLGKDSPSTAVIEFATCSPFGMEIIGGDLVFFDPYGWTPLEGIETALKSMGWKSTLIINKDEDEALERLKREVKNGPVFVGPVEMGHLGYQPGNNGPIGADHYVVVLSVTDDDNMIELHDPHGFPYATLPMSDFMRAWKAESLGYGKPYMMRANFHKAEQQVSEEEVIRRTIEHGLRWLSMRGTHEDMPPNSSGNQVAALNLASMVQKSYTPALRGHLTYFAVRVGARRAADAASCLARVGLRDAAQIMERQARLIGSLQYILVKGDKVAAGKVLGKLAPTYEELRRVLEQSE